MGVIAYIITQNVQKGQCTEANDTSVLKTSIFIKGVSREERTVKCIPGFILILTNTKSGLFLADEAAYNNHASLTFNWK